MSTEKSTREPILKLPLLGSAKTGKTQLVKCMSQEKFEEEYQSTIGANYASKTLELNGTDLKLQVWDLAGEKRFDSITSLYLRGSDAIGIVLTLNKENQVDKNSITDQLSKILSIYHTPEAMPPVYFFVNKIDLCDQTNLDANKAEVVRQINEIAKPYTTGKPFISDETIFFCSAKTGEGVEDAFNKIALNGLDKLPISKNNDNAPINLNPPFSPNPHNKQPKSSFSIPSFKFSFNKLWAGVDALLIIGGIIIGALALAGIGLTAGAVLAPLAIAGITVGAAFALWNISCAIGKYIKHKRELESIFNQNSLDSQEESSDEDSQEVSPNKGNNLSEEEDDDDEDELNNNYGSIFKPKDKTPEEQNDNKNSETATPKEFL